MRLYLATALLHQVGRLPTFEENQRNLGAALVQLQQVLSREPNKSCGDLGRGLNLLLLSRNLDEAKRWFRRLTANVDDKTAHLAFGFINFAEVNRVSLPVQAVGAQPNDPGPIRDPAQRAVLRDGYVNAINDSIQSFTRVVSAGSRQLRCPHLPCPGTAPQSRSRRRCSQLATARHGGSAINSSRGHRRHEGKDLGKERTVSRQPPSAAAGVLLFPSYRPFPRSPKGSEPAEVVIRRGLVYVAEDPKLMRKIESAGFTDWNESRAI